MIVSVVLNIGKCISFEVIIWRNHTANLTHWYHTVTINYKHSVTNFHHALKYRENKNPSIDFWKGDLWYFCSVTFSHNWDDLRSFFLDAFGITESTWQKFNSKTTVILPKGASDNLNFFNQETQKQSCERVYSSQIKSQLC